MFIYTGIGSRETPHHINRLFTEIGERLGSLEWILRSGHAEGADKAFELGCDQVQGKKEIYLPWKGFNGSLSDLIVNDPRAFELAEQFHPAWGKCSPAAQKLHARNTHQILGWDLNKPADIVICWTLNGAMKGGTAQALRLAQNYSIPIFNAGAPDFLELLAKKINSLKEGL